MVLGSSTAAFTGESSSSGSQWNSGKVSIDDSASDSIGGQVLFSGEPISPGYEQERCVTVVSQSNVDTRVKMYGVDVTDNDLTQSIHMDVDEGYSAGDRKDHSCSDFSVRGPIFSGSISDFGKRASDYRTGISSREDGTPLEAGGRLTYRIKLQLPQETTNEVQGQSGGAVFKWEAQG